jgi:hypothetical protein
MTVSQRTEHMVYGPSGLRSEDEDFRTLRNRVFEGICRKVLQNNQDWFHGIEIVEDSAGGFYDKRSADEYQYSGDQAYYRQALEKIYRPLVEANLLVENENNNFTIPEDSKFREICRKQLSRKSYIGWDEFMNDVKSASNNDNK